MKNALLLVSLLLVGIVGCRAEYRRAPAPTPMSQVGAPQAPPLKAEVIKQAPLAGEEAGDVGFNGAFFGVKEGKQADQPPAEAKRAPAQRKIKQTADLQLIVEDFAKAQTELIQRVDRHNGIIARSDISTSPGSPRIGTWKVRIPVADFRAFCDEVLQLGEVQKNATDSEDLTERYADLKSHIKNRQEHRDELAKLRDKGGEIKYLLTVYNEISAVQLEIDRIQGQINLINNLTELTTVNVILNERQKYIKDKPPETVEKPSFTARAGKTFGDSTEALVDFGQNFAILCVGVAPWLPIIFLVAFATWLAMRRWNKPRAAEVVVADKA